MEKEKIAIDKSKMRCKWMMSINEHIQENESERDEQNKSKKSTQENEVNWLVPSICLQTWIRIF